MIRDIAFPKYYHHYYTFFNFRGFSEVFATCAESEIRVWNVQNQKELLRIELAKTGTEV